MSDTDVRETGATVSTWIKTREWLDWYLETNCPTIERPQRHAITDRIINGFREAGWLEPGYRIVPADAVPTEAERDTLRELADWLEFATGPASYTGRSEAGEVYIDTLRRLVARRGG